MRKLICFFCGEWKNTALFDFRWGTTGHRGTYRRRICLKCKKDPKIEPGIRGPWRGK